ncbi:MAG: hypothetical protein AMXMBFR83_29520 [Phycisphaerae bacterium]
MRTLDRYLLRSFLFSYVASLFVLVSLYVVLDLFLNLDEFTESPDKGVWQVVADIADYYFFNLPMYFSQLAGVITLFAACLTLARMQRANEMTAVLASGTSLYRLAAPIVFAGLVMNGLVVANQELLLPKVAAKLARSRVDVEGRVAAELWFIKDGSNLISAQRFQPSPGWMRKMYVMELDSADGRGGRLRSVIEAYQAEWDAQQRGWRLIDGRRHSVAADQSRLETTRVDFYASELSPADLVLRKIAAWNRFLSTAQLNQLVARGDVRADAINHLRHSRFTLPIHNMILLLLGMAFFLNRLPESVLTQGAKALATCAVSFLVAFAGQNLVGAITGAYAGSLPDWVSVLPTWVPIFLFGPLAVVLLDNVKT